MAETAGQRKVIGIIWFLVAIAGIASAFLVQPVGDWGIFTTVLAILVAIMGITGLWLAVSGKGSITGRNLSPKANRIVAIIGLIAATLLVGLYLVSDWANWTAMDVLSIAIWVALGAMFLEGIIATRNPS